MQKTYKRRGQTSSVNSWCNNETDDSCHYRKSIIAKDNYLPREHAST